MLKKCRTCGSKEFKIEQTVLTHATLNDKGELVEAFGLDNLGINLITCRECGEEYYPNDFTDIK